MRLSLLTFSFLWFILLVPSKNSYYLILFKKPYISHFKIKLISILSKFAQYMFYFFWFLFFFNSWNSEYAGVILLKCLFLPYWYAFVPMSELCQMYFVHLFLVFSPVSFIFVSVTTTNITFFCDYCSYIVTHYQMKKKCSTLKIFS